MQVKAPYYSRGGALIIALWFNILLLTLTLATTTILRIEAVQSSLDMETAHINISTQGALAWAAYSELTTQYGHSFTGSSNDLTIDGYHFSVTLRSEREKFDINACSLIEFSSFLFSAPLARSTSNKLISGLQQFRSKNKKFTAISQLMTIGHLERSEYDLLSPYITIFTGLERPDRSLASSQEQFARLTGGSSHHPGRTISAEVFITSHRGVSFINNFTIYLLSSNNVSTFKILTASNDHQR